MGSTWNEFLAMLEKTDSCYVKVDTLQLNKAKISALAKFVAVPRLADMNKWGCVPFTG